MGDLDAQSPKPLGSADFTESRVMAEKDLAEDAEWKLIQKNTFTRWTNEHLKKANEHIEHLEDLSDGLRLIALIEVLTKHKFRHINKNPVFRTQKLENVTKVLKFLEEEEKLRLVNIDSSHIVDCNSKLILGLMWSLITHYSISLPIYEGDVVPDHFQPKEREGPKQQLLKWAKVTAKFPVKNFTSDWSTGIAVGALVDGVAPGLCPDWIYWDKKEPVRNAGEAMTLAQDWLDVPQCIKPEEMVNPNVDETAIMTYVSGFLTAKLKPGAPLHPPINPQRVRAFGPGLEYSGDKLNKQCSFTVDASDAGRGNLQVVIINSNSVEEKCHIELDKVGPGIHLCHYTPTVKGCHRIIIKFFKQEIPGSPFEVMVAGPSEDLFKIRVSGPGIDGVSENRVGHRTYFTVSTEGAGLGELRCTIEDPDRRQKTVIPQLTRIEGKSDYLVEYTPVRAGEHQIYVYFADRLIPKAPFRVPVAPRLDSQMAYATGRGVQQKGIRVQEDVSFQVHTERCDEQANVTAKLVHPDGVSEALTVVNLDQFSWKGSYRPQRPGNYSLHVLFGDGDIQNSPFNISIGSHSVFPVTVFGQGLVAGVVNKPNHFTVFCKEQSNQIGFSIEGPSEAPLKCIDYEDGSACVTYKANQPGEYALHVTYGHEDISGSPFMVQIYPDTGEFRADRLQIHGPGIKPKASLSCGRPVEFYIEGLASAVPESTFRSITDVSLSSLIHTECANADGDPVPVRCHRRTDGVLVYSYTPLCDGFHTISVDLANIPLKGSPFRVNVTSEPLLNKVKFWGDGLKECTPQKPASFFIDPRRAFPEGQLQDALVYPVSARITDDIGRVVVPEVSRESDGTYRVRFVIDSGATEAIIIPMLGDTPIVESPIRVAVQAPFNLDAVKVVDLESRVFVSSYVRFTVDASAIDKGGSGNVTAELVTPDNESVLCDVENNGGGSYTCSYTPIEEGPHQIKVNYSGYPLNGSPFPIRVIAGCDPSRIKAYGMGLQNGPHLCPGVQAEFTIDLTGAGQGGLGLAVEGPSQTPIQCHDNRNGTCTVSYTPTEPGDYTICVRFNETNVPKSPFYVVVKNKIDPSQVQCYGRGLEPGALRAGWPAYFTVDTKKAGDAPLEVWYTPKPGETKRRPLIQSHGSASGKEISQPQSYHKVTFTPESEGPCVIDVLFDGKHVPGSPFTLQVRKNCEPENVHVYRHGGEGPIVAGLPAKFTVDARNAGMGDLTLGISDPKGQSVPVRVIPLAADSESVITDGAVPSVTSLASGDVSDTGLLLCTFEPFTAGPHTVHVMFGGTEVPGSPFIFDCIPSGGANLCKIQGDIPRVIEVDLEQAITVSIPKTETGALSCQVAHPPADPSESAATLLPVELVDNKDGTVTAYYRPTQPGDVCVELRYGGEVIPDGEVTQKVVLKEDVKSRVQNQPAAFRPVEFRLPAPSGDVAIESIILLPSGGRHTAEPVLNDDGSITITYEPVEQGMHELHVNGISKTQSGGPRSGAASMPLQGSPYRFYVDSLRNGNVTAFGPGLSLGVANEQAKFTVLANKPGGGGLSLSVEGPSKAEITCEERSDGTVEVGYLPLVPGTYTINIKSDGEHIAGSPFTAKIAENLLKRAQLTMGAPNDIALEASGDDISTLSARVISSSGREESCVLKRLPNNRLGISFTPKEVGEHKISVYQAGQHIPNSPFLINISDKEIGDPSRVRVSGPGLIEGFCHVPNLFNVDTRKAGYAGLSLSIEGPSKAEIECQDNHDGTCSVSYVPSEPGSYVISVKYADVHVPNSPFFVNIDGTSSAKYTERLTKRREATSVTTVGSRCELSLRVADIKLHDIVATVIAPSNQTIPCEILQTESDHYNIKFVPQEMGEHLVYVKNKGINIAGSPFQFTVGPITDGVASKVRAVGLGSQCGFADQDYQFIVHTREAGAGTLAIAVEGPSKADIYCNEQPDGSSLVGFRVPVGGSYTCSLKFNDEHIPFSPFKIFIEESDVSGQVTSYSLPRQSSMPRPLASSQLSNSEEFRFQMGRTVAFTTYHEKVGDEVLLAKVYSPKGSMADAIVQPISRDQYSVRFMPNESGLHFIYVYAVPPEIASKVDIKLGSDSSYRQIEGSPFQMDITCDTADPGMVYAHGDGLHRGAVGEENTFFVNTTNAGTGVLSVTVDGPSKVALTTKEEDNGYRFNYRPAVPGAYEISIKYGGNFHIADSPFKVNIVGSPSHLNWTQQGVEEQSQVVLETVGKTASSHQHSEFYSKESTANPERVRVQGLGVKRAEIDRDNHFSVDASDAGSDILLVGIHGPTLPFQEVKVQFLARNRYSVSYRVQERGRHRLFVMWGNQHVPGSPFIVDVP